MVVLNIRELHTIAELAYIQNSDQEMLIHGYTQRALQVDGNTFGIGGKALFDDTYHGEAYTDIIEEYIGITHNYFFGSIGAAYRNVRLPGRTYMNRTVPDISGKAISFLLYIKSVGWEMAIE